MFGILKDYKNTKNAAVKGLVRRYADYNKKNKKILNHAVTPGS